MTQKSFLWSQNQQLWFLKAFASLSSTPLYDVEYGRAEVTAGLAIRNLKTSFHLLQLWYNPPELQDVGTLIK